ncbi:hypothetical protein SAMN02982929_06528 [Saccharopolyspora kobensis]|uniref:Uncharacterized protein n=1 Tax=Saccharopolyspora kobensis TaxID=146035 RepID=A0A1H6EIC8_9PSEU|nr:hypothetical protein [Saccharopolyspora kobensis]SEG96706.1 hypothetical protein SAMN02982929_06528 [Saccharopolyspora kobensis]SFF04464.1 hypothetical protein SAMN05216506_11819 [Saccharopolyspora kobensis]
MAHLTERSGFCTAEAFGAIAAKLASLAFAGLCAWIIAMMVEDGGVGVVIVGPFIALVLVLAVWIGLFLVNRPVIERLRPANRFHRLRRSPASAAPAGRRRELVTAEPPERVLRFSPRGQADLFWRTGLFLLLGFLSAYLLAYLDHRRSRRALRADRTAAYGYALCDLWVHSEERVSASLTVLRASAERVTELERVAGRSMPEGTPRWFSALFARR